MVTSTAERAQAAMAAEYPVRDYGARAGRGNLRKGLRVEFYGDARSGTSARIRNVSPHAWIFENGTAPRKWANGKSTGSMPAGRVFIPLAIRFRRAMTDALVALVERAGLTVSGDDDGA